MLSIYLLNRVKGFLALYPTKFTFPYFRLGKEDKLLDTNYLDVGHIL